MGIKYRIVTKDRLELIVSTLNTNVISFVREFHRLDLPQDNIGFHIGTQNYVVLTSDISWINNIRERLKNKGVDLISLSLDELGSNNIDTSFLEAWGQI